jgi:hypothetical protein
MPRIRRVNDPNGEPIGTADSQESINGLIEVLGPGQYHISEISSDPLPSGHTSRRRGAGIKQYDGKGAVDPDPWPTAKFTACESTPVWSNWILAQPKVRRESKSGLACRRSNCKAPVDGLIVKSAAAVLVQGPTPAFLQIVSVELAS